MKKSMLIILVAMGIAGCQLETPLDVGESCADMRYITLESGERCLRGECPEYKDYFNVNHCPLNYICSKDTDNLSFCLKDCRNNKSLVVCEESCIDPGSSSSHCGAKGFCNSDDENDENFKGYACVEGQSCKLDVDGRYRCACSDNYIVCDDNGVLKCVVPNSLNYCGASGLCNDPNPESENYVGEHCAPDQYCQTSGDSDKYRCICPNDGVFCDGVCVETSDQAHCGARGRCDSDSSQSENYRGKKCQDGEFCLAAKGVFSCYPCDMSSGTVDYCDDEKCHDIAKDPDNCGRCGEICPSRTGFTDVLGKPSEVIRRCEDKKCCYVGELAASNNDYINLITCCAGTEMYKYTNNFFGCMNKTHYACYTKEEAVSLGKCWK